MLPKDIFLDATGIGLTPTGLGKYCYHLLRAIAEDKRHCFRLTILHQRNLPKSHILFSIIDKRMTFLPSGIPVLGPKRDFLVYVALRRKINQYDLYHCLSSYLPAYGIKIPTVVTIHDLKYVIFPELLSDWLKAKYYLWIVKMSARKSTKIIAVSTATKSDLLALGASPEKISVIHEASTISSKSSASTSATPYPTDKPFFLYVGDSRPHKNISRILSAYRSMMQKMGENSPSFVFVGSNVGSTYSKHVKGLENRIFFMPPVNDETLAHLYRNATALVYPSLYEGFGLPLLEAMSLGTPVITSNRSAMLEVAGNAAILVDPLDTNQIRDAMVQIATNKEVADRLRKFGLNRAQSFSWERTAQETLRLYRTILDTSTPANN